MEIKNTDIKDLYLLQGVLAKDTRGSFLKVFNHGDYRKLGLEAEFKECYYSTSHKNVIRGMHFQAPPHDHVKVVSVISGKILDVVVDIRKNSPTYGQHFSTTLTPEAGRSVYIGKGMAHGFLSLEDNTIVQYLQTTEYSRDADKGILWSSLGFDWGVDNPIMSDRDKSFPAFTAYESPF